LQWAKTLRDLVELRNTTLLNIKAHLLGRDETGATNEPDDVYARNAQVEYERYFRSLLTAWTREDLKLECEDCGVDSEDVSHHNFQEIRDEDWKIVLKEEGADLCPQSVEKRETARQQKAKEHGIST
jgi:hypothetical protein